MEFSKQDMKFLKGVAILFMLSLHLFCRKEVNGLYETFPVINGVPFIYYLALFCDACVPIYCFASGYGLFVSQNKIKKQGSQKNFLRIFKLLINYWIILFIFILVGFFAGNPHFPGRPTKVILNFFVLSDSYNAAWWFLQTYIILVLISPLMFTLVKKYSSLMILTSSGFIYFVSYIQRIKHVIDLSHHPLLNMIATAVVLFGTSQLPFIAGAIFAKDKIYTFISKKAIVLQYKNSLCVAGIILLILLHAYIQTIFIAPFTGIAFICLFSLIDKGKVAQKYFNFLVITLQTYG